MELKRKYILEGGMVKSLFHLSIPILIGNLLQTAYNIVDTLWLGRVGAEAVAAVSFSFPIIFLMISFGGGLSVAGIILVSQYTGAQKFNQLEKTIGQSFLTILVISFIISLTGIFSSKYILLFLGASSQVLPLANAYLKIIFTGIFFMFLFGVFQAILHGWGDTVTPMRLMIISVTMNIILDPLFIFGWWGFPRLGVQGAAWATIISQCFLAISALLYLLYTKKEIRLTLKSLTPDFKIIKKIICLGLPSSIEQSVRALGFNGIIYIVAPFGTMVVAAYGIGMRIIGVIIMASMSFSIATSTIVGQNMGANNFKRAREAILKISGVSFLILESLGIITFIFSTQISAIFITNNPEVVSICSLYLKIVSLSFGLVGISFIINGGLRGSGDTVAAMVLTIIALWLIRIPLAWILSHKTALSYHGIWWAFLIGNILTVSLAALYFKTGLWQTKAVSHETALREKISKEIPLEET